MRKVINGKVQTKSGLLVDAPPALRMESPGKLRNDLNKLASWRKRVAIAEAVAVGNGFAEQIFKRIPNKSQTQAEADEMMVFVFGEQCPEFEV